MIVIPVIQHLPDFLPSDLNACLLGLPAPSGPQHDEHPTLLHRYFLNLLCHTARLVREPF